MRISRLFFEIFKNS